MHRRYAEVHGRPGGLLPGQDRDEVAEATERSRASGSGEAWAPAGGTFQANIGYGDRLFGTLRRHAVTPGIIPEVQRDRLALLTDEQLKARCTQLRSREFTQTVFDGLDTRNLLKLARFEDWAQEAFVGLYHQNRDVRNLNAHVAHALDGVRHLLERGVDEHELRRLGRLARSGEVKFAECYGWAKGSCRYGDSCHYAHVGQPGQAVSGYEMRLGRTAREDDERRSRNADRRRRRSDDGPSPPSPGRGPAAEGEHGRPLGPLRVRGGTVST